MSTIIQPGMSQIHHEAHPGDLATPVQFTVKTDAGLILHTWGGFSRQEVVAMHLAAARMQGLPELAVNIENVARLTWRQAGQLLKQYETLAAAEPQSQPDQA